MKRYYLAILLLFFTLLPFAHAQNVCIEPMSDTFHQWLPEDGDKVTFLVTVSGAGSSGSIVLNLTNVSTWEGVCMNKGTGNDADLYFDAEDQVKAAYADVEHARSGKVLNAGLPALPHGATRNQFNGNKLTWSISNNGATATLSWVSAAYLPTGFTIPVTVRCRDYAAFATLEANFNGKATINIPKDDNGDYIADAWRDGLQLPYEDAETGPDTGDGVEENDEIGDGLALFEEYRGFYVAGEHTRLDPTKKDIFIHSAFTVFNEVTYLNTISGSYEFVPRGITKSGIGYARNLPSVFQIHEILSSGETEMGEAERTVNFNSLGRPTDFGAADNEDSDWRVMDKEAIWIEKNTDPFIDPNTTDDTLGETSMDGMTITIYSNRIRGWAEFYDAAAFLPGSPASWINTDGIEETCLARHWGMKSDTQ